MYGKERYGLRQYGVDGVPQEEKQEYYEDLAPLAPEFITTLREMKELYTAEGYEIGYLQHILKDVVSQCFIASATWGLDRWEKLLGLHINLNLTYEERREILAAKLRGQGTTTAKMLQDAAAAFSGGDVEVVEENANNSFIIRFIGIKGIPRNMQGLLDMLEEIKPAHLAYHLEYRYTVWNEMNKFTWEQLSAMTWGDTRTMVEV